MLSQRHSPTGATVGPPRPLERRPTSSTISQVTSLLMALQEASDVRKARLIALRKRKAGEATGDEEVTEPVIKYRTYDPETKTLKKRTDEDVEMDTVEKHIDGLAQQIIQEDEQQRAQDLDLHSIAPKRPNWDLKRDLDKKLAKLERRTQEAIHILIRQRLAAQKGQSDDLVGAMRAQEKQEESEGASDEED